MIRAIIRIRLALLNTYHESEVLIKFDCVSSLLSLIDANHHLMNFGYFLMFQVTLRFYMMMQTTV